MTMTVASFADAAWPGLNQMFGMAYSRYPAEWREIFAEHSSSMNFERDIVNSGLGLFRIKPETAPISYDDMNEVRRVDYQHLTYALGFVMSREAIEDNLYPELADMRAKELGEKASITQETLAAIFMSRTFSNSYLQSDGVPVFSTAHPLGKGGTSANRPTNGVDFSEAALENAIIDVQNMKDESGQLIAVRPEKLIVPKELQFDVKRVLGDSDRPGTADRDINAIVHLGMIPQGYAVNHYLTDSDAWFLRTSAPGFKHFTRRPIEFKNDTADFDTENARFKCSFRDSRGVSDWRNFWGSPGA
jgi:hypothetical protein